MDKIKSQKNLIVGFLATLAGAVLVIGWLMYQYGQQQQEANYQRSRAEGFSAMVDKLQAKYEPHREACTGAVVISGKTYIDPTKCDRVEIGGTSYYGPAQPY